MKHAISLITCIALFACDSVPPQQIAAVEEPVAVPAASLNLDIPEEDSVDEASERKVTEEHDDIQGIHVRRMELTDEIRHREPIAAREVFEEVERLYLFLDLKNEADHEHHVYVSFIGPDGLRRGNVKLRIPPNARWRTWAYTQYATQPGTWNAVLSLDSEEIATKQFEVL